jgi:putative peptidoglycan lipid II flippase
MPSLGGVSLTNSAAKKSLVVTVGSISNVAVGFVFQLLLARSLGLGQSADVFALGAMVPTLVATILIGSTPSVLVPAISRLPGDHTRIPIGMFFKPSLIVTALIVAVLGASVVFVPLTASNLSPEAKSDLLAFVLISSLAMPLAWVSALGQSVLLAKERFLGVGFSGAINGIALLGASAWSLSGDQTSITSWLATSFVFGYLVQAVFLGSLASLWVARVGTRRGMAVSAQLLTLLGAAVIYKSQPIIERTLAATLIGGPAAFAYADKLSQAVLLGSTLGLSLISLPSISRYTAQGDLAGAWKVSQRVSLAIAAFSAPLVAGGVLLGDEVVMLVYSGGNFESSDVQVVTAVLTVALLGVFFSAISGPIVNLLYGVGRYRFVATMSVVTTASGAALSLGLREPFGLAGIAGGSLAAFFVNYVVFLRAARSATGTPWGWRNSYPALLLGGLLGMGFMLRDNILDSLLGELSAFLQLVVMGLLLGLLSGFVYWVMRRGDEGSILGTR